MSERKELNRYIVFEGNDGSGKTTIAETIAQKLRGDVVYTKEPGSPHLKFCKDVRQLIIHGKEQNLDDITYAHLFYADAHENLRQIVEPSLKAGKWVVSDRSVLSNLAYWPINVQYVHLKHHDWFADLNPLIFYLYVTPEECLRRITSRAKEMNEFEKSHVVDKLETIHWRYENLVLDEILSKELTYHQINNMRPIEDVIDVVWGLIISNYKEV